MASTTIGNLTDGVAPIGTDLFVVERAGSPNVPRSLSWTELNIGNACLAAPFTSIVQALASTNLSVTLQAGLNYAIDGYLTIGNSTNTEGAQFDFNGGGATITTFDVTFFVLSGTNTPGTLTSTTLAGVLNWTSITATCKVQVFGMVKVLAAGTIILRAGENSVHASGTLTVGAASWLSFTPMTAK